MAPLGRSSSGSIKVNINWLHYTDHDLAPLGRSQGGSIRAIFEWLHIGGHQQHMTRTRGLWGFNRNIWTHEGVYVIQDIDAKGTIEHVNVNELEKMFKRGEEIDGLRFSKDGKIRFAPIETYDLGGHTPESLSKDGVAIASFGKKGAKKLGKVADKFKERPFVAGIYPDDIPIGEQYKISVTYLSTHSEKLFIRVSATQDIKRNLGFISYRPAFGVLK